MEVGPAETSPQHVDDSVPLAFLLGKKFNYYMDPHLHTATLEERPRTPTDFHDMSKRQRELRAKMVLDPLSHNDEMLSGEVFQSIPARRAWKKERIKTAIATSNATDNQPRAFLAVAARPVPTIHDKANAVKQEAQNARLKQQWRMIHAQRIQSIAMEQREYAQHLLSMMEHPRQANNTAKSAMSQKREELERVKKHQEAELALVKEEKERALAELRRDIEYRNQTAKMKKTVVTKKQLPMEKAKLYKLDENGATLEDQFDSTGIPRAHAKVSKFQTVRPGKMQKYVMKSQSKNVLGGGFHTAHDAHEKEETRSVDSLPIHSLTTTCCHY